MLRFLNKENINSYFVAAGFAALFFFSFFLNIQKSLEFEFGKVVLPHHMGIEVVGSHLLFLLAYSIFALRSENPIGYFFTGIFCFSGIALLRFTISDELLLGIFVSCLLLIYIFNSNHRLTKYFVNKQSVNKQLINPFSFVLLVQFVSALMGLSNNFYSIRYVLIFSCLILLLVFIHRELDEVNIQKLLLNFHWPMVFICVLNMIWWSAIFFGHGSENGVYFGSLVGVGYTGLSQREFPMLVLLVSSTLRLIKCQKNREIILVLTLLLLMSLFADSRLGLVIVLCYICTTFIILKIRALKPVCFSIVGCFLFLTVFMDYRVVNYQGYANSFSKISESSPETITYSYQGQDVETQKYDYGRLEIIQISLKFITSLEPQSIIGCGTYGADKCVTKILDDTNFLQFKNPNIVFNYNGTESGLPRLNFFYTLSLESGLLGIVSFTILGLHIIFRAFGAGWKWFSIYVCFGVPISIFLLIGYVHDNIGFFILLLLLSKIKLGRFDEFGQTNKT